MSQRSLSNARFGLAVAADATLGDVVEICSTLLAGSGFVVIPREAPASYRLGKPAEAAQQWQAVVDNLAAYTPGEAARQTAPFVPVLGDPA